MEELSSSLRSHETELVEDEKKKEVKVFLSQI